MEAEKKLLLPQNEHGAFLIRDSESRRNDYSLSVRDGDTVKHYRIRQLDEGGFFIARRTTFRTLQELVDHYSRDADGLCVNLRKACIQVCVKKFFQIYIFIIILWAQKCCWFIELYLTFGSNFRCSVSGVLIETSIFKNATNKKQKMQCYIVYMFTNSTGCSIL